MKSDAPPIPQTLAGHSNPLPHQMAAALPCLYEIRVEGQLDGTWAEWFDGMTIAPQENGETLLSGPVVDQAALFGVLKKVRDVGMTLVSVQRVKNVPANAPEGK